MPLVDALKGVAAQIILLHHLVSYGPLARAAARLWPSVAGLLLHGIFDVPSLSVGVWYVAIDFQLYAMLTLMLWLATLAGGSRGAGVAAGLVALVGAASLFGFNRHPSLDDWGIYFFGSYALGAFAWWLADRRHTVFWLAVPALVALAALLLDFRLRIALALSVAAFLAAACRTGWLFSWPKAALFGFLGRISFSVFLLHFPIYLLFSALYVRFGGGGDPAAVGFMVCAWGTSILAADCFQRKVESRQRWLPAGLLASVRGLFSARRP